MGDFLKKSIYIVEAIIQRQGKILCVQHLENEALSLLWGLPGGKVRPGELPEESLALEMKEKLNYPVTVGKAFEHSDHEYDFGTVHLSTFLCSEETDHEPRSSAYNTLQWTDIEDLLTLDWAPTELPILEKLQELLNRAQPE